MATAALTLRFDTTDVTHAIRQLRRRVPRAIARAVTRSAKSARTTMARAVSRDLSLKVGVVRSAIALTEATPARHRARLVASGRRIPLIAFGAKGPEPSRGRGRGVTARLGGSRRRYPHAFLARTRSGHRGVFRRVRTRRLPVTQLHGPSIGHVFATHLPEGLRRAHEQLAKNIRHALRFALQQG